MRRRNKEELQRYCNQLDNTTVITVSTVNITDDERERERERWRETKREKGREMRSNGKGE